MVDKQLLMDALAKVKPGLSTKEFIEQATSFAFTNGRIITYNDEISISHPVPNIEFEGAIEAEPLYSLLGKITQKTVNFIVRENELVIRAGRIKAGFKLQSEIKLPLEEISGKRRWKKLANADEFIKGLKFVRFSTSRDLTRPVLTCVNVLQEGELQATDAYRATTYKVPPMPVKDFLLPIAAVNVIIGYNVTSIAETTGWVHFKTEDDTILSARTYEDTYPPINEHMSVKGQALPLPDSLGAIVERSLVFTKREISAMSSVEISLSEDVLKVSGAADIGWYKETAVIEYKHAPVVFVINPLFLIDIAHEKGWKVIISTAGDRMLFTGKGWRHLLLLVVTAVTVKDKDVDDDLPY